MSNRKKTRWIRRTVWGIVIGVFVWFWMLPLLIPFGSVSICQRCGRAKYSTELRIPLIDVPYFWTSHVNDTKFSSVAENIVMAHECHWMFAHGGGAGIVCAIGKGSPLLNVVHHPTIVSYIRNVDRFDGREAAQAWIERCLDPDQAEAACHWVEWMNFPESGFDSEDEYRKWNLKAATEGAEILLQRDN